MELIYYRCRVCGFVYQMPAYWSGFSPEEKMEMEHFNIETKELCGEKMLVIDKSI